VAGAVILRSDRGRRNRVGFGAPSGGRRRPGHPVWPPGRLASTDGALGGPGRRRLCDRLLPRWSGPAVVPAAAGDLARALARQPGLGPALPRDVATGWRRPGRPAAAVY